MLDYIAFNSIEWILKSIAYTLPCFSLSIPLNGFLYELLYRVVCFDYDSFNSIEWIPSITIFFNFLLATGYLSIPLNGFNVNSKVCLCSESILSIPLNGFDDS